MGATAVANEGLPALRGAYRGAARSRQRRRRSSHQHPAQPELLQHIRAARESSIDGAAAVVIVRAIRDVH